MGGDQVKIKSRLKSRNYYWEAIKKHRRTVALIIALMTTLPLFVFTALPPAEVKVEKSEEIAVEVPVPVQIPVNVTKVIQIPINITEEVVVNTTITANVTEGESIFLDPQPPPPFLDNDIILCIDTSGSMNSARMSQAQKAISRLLEQINNSNSAGLSRDRVALVSYAGVRDWNWSNDAVVRAGLDFAENQTHMLYINDTASNFEGSGWTDVWSGLNASLDLLFTNPRNTSALKSIILLADGEHNTGPWGVDVTNGNYTGFLRFPANFSSQREGGPYSENPIMQARENNVKIYSIGFLIANPIAENLLRNISLNPDYGTFGDFLAGNDTLSLTESFLRARDQASGWVSEFLVDTIIAGDGSKRLFTYNVTSNTRKLKWDLNWDNSAIDFNIAAIDPNGTIIDISSNVNENIIPIANKQPKSVIFDFPAHGLWQFNISWTNISTPDLIKARLSTYQPPIFIDAVTLLNSTRKNDTQASVSGISRKSLDQSSTSDEESFSGNWQSEIDYNMSGTQSALFLVNVTNKNPIFTYHNITPHLLANFTDINMSSTWEPPVISQLMQNETTSFLLNITLLEPALLQGEIYFKVNCSEGYYDAYAQLLALDYRINVENVTVETRFENQTITVYENQTITVLENQTTYVIDTTNTFEYTYDRQMVDTLKWIGLVVTLALLMSFLAIYVRSKEIHLRNLASTLHSRLFKDQEALITALQREGIDLPPGDINNVIARVDDLDRFSETIFDLTGNQLSPDVLIKIISDASIEQIAHRLNYVTGIPVENIIVYMKEATSIESLLQKIALDHERFLDIIARDEDVINFQAKIRNLITSASAFDVSEITQIMIFEDIDVSRFKARLRNVFHSR
jgi:hypothetical protein